MTQPKRLQQSEVERFGVLVADGCGLSTEGVRTLLEHITALDEEIAQWRRTARQAQRRLRLYRKLSRERLASWRDKYDGSKTKHLIEAGNKGLRRISAERDSLRQQLEAAQKEINEQCRLNGMGAQRELKLKTQLEAAKAREERLVKALSDIMSSDRNITGYGTTSGDNKSWWSYGPYGRIAKEALHAHEESKKEGK